MTLQSSRYSSIWLGLLHALAAFHIVDSSELKDTYQVGVLVNRGIETAFNEFNATFADYLTAVAGQKFDPPIRFEMQPVAFKTVYDDASKVDFMFMNPSAFSCIESEFGAQSLVTLRSRRKVGGKSYDLTKFGGVIIARADNDDVNHLQDLRGKIVAAVSISGLGSGQMQFREMKLAGMSHFTDLKQLIFTSNQGKIVNGVLSGDFDVGFIRTDQLERSKDADGNLLDPSLFKIIDPKPNLEIDGEPFPFQASTPLYPEWNMAAQMHVDERVAKEVQLAMLAIEDSNMHYNELQACREKVNNTRDCDEMLMVQMGTPDWVSYNRSIAEAELASIAMTKGKYSGWRTSLSYMQLRSMQEATGFITRDEESKTWRCVRTSELYDAITCPKPYTKKSKEEIENGCADAGLECEDDYTCICSPCIKPLVCDNNNVMIFGTCVSYGIVVGAMLLPIVLITIFVVRAYLRRKRKQADSVWHIEPKELDFGNCPTVLGEGSFGRVVLAEYRGTKVAVKRIAKKPANKVTNRRSSFIQRNLDVCESGTCSGGVLMYDPEMCLEKSTFTFTRDSANATVNPLLASIESYTHSKTRSSSSERRASREKLIIQQTSLESLKADFVREMRLLSKLRHPSICTVMGAVISKFEEPMLVLEYAAHGSLFDLLRSQKVALDGEQLHPILCDIIQGIRFLHSAKPQILHGDLKTKNILIDSSFRAKVSDFGLSTNVKNSATGTLYWMAPELLGHSTNTAKSDIYSFGILMNEIYSKKIPYEGEDKESVMALIVDPKVNKRPEIPDTCPKEAINLMKHCWSPSPSQRPTAEDVDLHIKMQDASEYAPIGSRTKKAVLYDVFPRHIADALSAGRTVEPESHDSVSVFFSDIVGFTTIASTFAPIKVSSLLDRLYKAFDDLSVEHDVFKIETTGDAYMAVSNLVKDQSEDHAKRIALFALDAIQAASETLIDLDDPSRGYVQIRVGFHVGPVVSNVVGNLNPKYGIFGDAVNTASRMESTSEVDCVQCSEPAAQLLMVQAPKSVKLTPRGHIEMKGLGEMMTYWVSGRRPSDRGILDGIETQIEI